MSNKRTAAADDGTIGSGLADDLDVTLAGLDVLEVAHPSLVLVDAKAGLSLHLVTLDGRQGVK